MYFPAIVWCVMENHGYEQVKDLSVFKYLASHGAVCTDFHGVTHPSGPNYRAIASGHTWTTREVFNEREPNVASELAQRGILTLDWMVRGAADLKHDPYRDLRTPNLMVLWGALAPDRLPQRCQVYLGFDDEDNGHNLDATLDAIDRNLWDVITTLDRSKWFNTPVNGKYPVFVVTWDEAYDPQNHVLTAFYGRGVKAGFASRARYNHYDFCRTLTDNWGLAPLGEGASARPITDVWK